MWRLFPPLKKRGLAGIFRYFASLCENFIEATGDEVLIGVYSKKHNHDMIEYYLKKTMRFRNSVSSGRGSIVFKIVYKNVTPI